MSDEHDIAPAGGLSDSAADRDEALLIEQVRSGDQQAFEALVRRHHDRVWRVMRRMRNDERETEEAVQEVFLTAQRTLASLEGETRISTWLLRIASNQERNQATGVRGVSSRPRPATDAGGTEVESRPSADRPLKPEAMKALLAECFERLHGDLRSALAVQLEGAGYDEIAQAVAAPVWTVRSRIFRARQAMSSCMLDKRAGRG